MVQLPGNRGRVIPRDKHLLETLYWTENRSLTEVAALFDVTHKSVSRVFHILGIAVRPRRTKGQSRWRHCVECGASVVKVWHATNGSHYGKRCREHQAAHKHRLMREDGKRPEVKARRKELLERWYVEGPINPIGEDQWISKSKALLRSAKRLLLNPTSPRALKSRIAVSAREQTSQI